MPPSAAERTLSPDEPPTGDEPDYAMQVGIDEAVKQFQEGPAGPLRLERIANTLEDDLLDDRTQGYGS